MKLLTLRKKYKDEVRTCDALFRKDCFAPRLHTHKLTGKFKGFWSFSITSTHRILFQFYRKDSVIFVDVGDNSIYK